MARLPEVDQFLTKLTPDQQSQIISRMNNLVGPARAEAGSLEQYESVAKGIGISSSPAENYAGGLGDYVPETQDTIFDDILKEQQEQMKITTGQANEDYNRFLQWSIEDKTIYKSELAKEYAKSLTKNFETAVVRGGPVSSIRSKGQQNLADVRGQKEQEFARQQERDRQTALLNKERTIQGATRSYASTIRNMGYQPAFIGTY
jgi:hypothetical protein